MGTATRDKKHRVIHYKKQTQTAGRQPATPRAGKEQRQSAAGELFTVRVDERGRVTLPARARAELGVQTGAVFYVEKADYGFRLARLENPFDGLARYAIAEADAGRARDIREYARERNFRLGDE